MDARSRELVLLGASVSAHCFPCFDFHLEQARKLGVCEDDILEAVRASSTVMKGAGSKMMVKIKKILPDAEIKAKTNCASVPDTWKVRMFSRVRY